MPYKEWAENHIARIKGVLGGACAEHTQTVKGRIDEVGQMKDVISLTKRLFSKVRSPPFFLMAHQSCGPFGYRRLHSPRLTCLCDAVLKPRLFI